MDEKSTRISNLRRNLIIKPCGFDSDKGLAESLGISAKKIQRWFKGETRLTKEEYGELLRTLTNNVDNNQNVIIDVCNQMIRFGVADNDKYNEYIRISEVYGYAAFWDKLLAEVFGIRPKDSPDAERPVKTASSSIEIEYDEFTEKMLQLLDDHKKDMKAFEPVVDMLNELCTQMLFDKEYCEKYGCSKNIYDIAYRLTDYYDHINKQKSIELAKRIFSVISKRKSLNLDDIRLLTGSAYTVAIASKEGDVNENIQLAEDDFRFVKKKFKELVDFGNMNRQEKEIYALYESDYAAFKINCYKIQLSYVENKDFSSLTPGITKSLLTRLKEAREHHTNALRTRQELLAYPDLSDETKRKYLDRLNISRQNLAVVDYYTAKVYLTANEKVRIRINERKKNDGLEAALEEARKIHDKFISWKHAKECAENAIAIHKKALEYWEETGNETKIGQSKTNLKGAEDILKQIMEHPLRK